MARGPGGGHKPDAAGEREYVARGSGGLDEERAPGTGTPGHGGFLWGEVRGVLQGLAARGEVVGMDLVEVSPPYDPAGVTSILAAQVLLNFLGYCFHR